MSAEAQSWSVRTYGGWRRPASPGIGPLKLIPTLGLLSVLAVVVLVGMTLGLRAGVGLLLFGGILGAPAVIPWRGRTLYTTLLRRWAWHRHIRRHRHMYRSGIAGVTPDGARRLPGLLARVRVWRAQDAFGREFALIEIPQARHWAVVLRVSAQAGALVDADTKDVWVACWGEWLAQLGQEGGVVQAAVVVETAPDPGALLAAHVAAMTREDAPLLARDVMRHSAEEFPVDVAETVGYVTLTFSERGLGVTRGRNSTDAAQVAAEEIGRRLPGLAVSLKEVGASAGHPLTAAQLAQRVREAYDPVAAVEFARARATGQEYPVDWADAGPQAHEERWGSYVHDSGVSRTWEALKVPPGIVHDSLMERLMGPTPGAPRKRVTMLFRPVDAGETASVVDRDLRAAINRGGRRRGVAHAHDSAGVRAARQAADEEAEGAGVTSFSILVTVTVTDARDFDRACETVDRAGRAARVRLSPVFGSQAAAFAGALGVGLSLPDLSVVPQPAREHI